MFHASRGRPARHLGLLIAGLIVAMVGCSRKPMTTAPLPTLTLAPDFSIQDVNPNSTTHGQDVSPRAQLGKVSAWYFGHAT
jgi:hypothetical protein